MKFNVPITRFSLREHIWILKRGKIRLFYKKLFLQWTCFLLTSQLFSWTILIVLQSNPRFYEGDIILSWIHYINCLVGLIEINHHKFWINTIKGQFNRMKMQTRTLQSFSIAIQNFGSTNSLNLSNFLNTMHYARKTNDLSDTEINFLTRFVNWKVFLWSAWCWKFRILYWMNNIYGAFFPCTSKRRVRVNFIWQFG